MAEAGLPVGIQLVEMGEVSFRGPRASIQWGEYDQYLTQLTKGGQAVRVAAHVLGLDPTDGDLKTKLRSKVWSWSQYLKTTKRFHLFQPVVSEGGVAVVRRRVELDPATANQAYKAKPKAQETTDVVATVGGPASAPAQTKAHKK